MANEAGGIILGDLDEETQKNLADKAAQFEVDPDEGTPDARTAFILVVNEDGSIAVSTDVPSLKLEREATPIDIKSALSEALDFFRAQQIASGVQQAMLQQMMAMQQAQQQRQMVQGLGDLKGGLRG